MSNFNKEMQMDHMSTTIGKLAEALSKAQGQIEGSKMDGNNPYFKSHYSTLSSVWDACRKPLCENGLSVVQTNEQSDDGKCVVVTTLLHSSGEWIRGVITMTPVKIDPQGIGSCITYARRYSLASIVGVSPQDDDAEGATNHGQEKGQEPKPQEPKPQSGKPMTDSERTNIGLITSIQINALLDSIKANGIEQAPWKAWLLAEYETTSVSTIRMTDFQAIIDTVTKTPDVIKNYKTGGTK